MNPNEILKVAIAENSIIVRTGLTGVLKRLIAPKVQPFEVLSMEALRECIRMQSPEVLIVNPLFCDFFDVARFREELQGRKMRIVALVTSFVDPLTLSRYDEHLSLFDDWNVIAGKVNLLVEETADADENEESDSSEALSSREKEIVVCVVKGMTNKEIAEQLFLSIHTVITHRRNISKKLQIHSAAGLTIYAIVNKLVALEDVKGL